MRTINLFFAGVSTLLGIAAFIGAAFYNAPWHFWTAGFCTVLAILCFFAKTEIKKGI